MNDGVIAGLHLVAFLIVIDTLLALSTEAVLDLLELCRELELSGPEWRHL